MADTKGHRASADDEGINVNTYITQFESDVRGRLAAMRKVIRDVAPEAVESFAYGMPAYKLHGKPLVYFAGFPHHIGFYATPNGHEAFKKEFAPYKQGKGSVQFPLNQPLPLELVKKVVRFRVQQLS